MQYSFFVLTQLTVEQQLAEKYCPSKTNLKRSCSSCGSLHSIKNGCTHNAKSKRQCNECGRQFLLNPSQKTVSEETKRLIDTLLLRGIERVTEVSWSWLQNYLNDKFAAVACQVSISEKARGKLTIECDELWSFVFSKENKFYVWLAIDRKTREIVGCYIGDRSRASAKKLWASLPAVYRQCAVAYTDFWVSYEKVIPSKCHQAIGKETGQTNHIERLNNTFRQRISRLGSDLVVVVMA